jgi:hypothetical protein
MQFLSLYTPAKAPSGPPSPEHMARMGQLIEEFSKAGKLVTTGGILSRETALKVTLKEGAFNVQEGPIAGSSLMPAAGYALLRANSRDELITDIKKFLDAAGADGACEIIQVMG